MDINADYADCLKTCGLKNTKHRVAILNILNKSEQPMPAEQIYFQLKEKDICVNLSTVYRILETLVKKNLVIKFSISGDSKSLFEYNNNVHTHYLVCSNCKKLLAIKHCPLDEYEKFLEKETGFSITGHKLYIFGLCMGCKNKI